MEIEQTLRRYGADEFAFATSRTRATIAFVAAGRMVRFELSIPDPDSHEFRYTPKTRVRRSDAAQRDAYDQATRQRWRALALVIKAKLEAVDAGIVTFEDEFMAHFVLPDGTRVGDYVQPAIAQAYESGQMPSLLALETGR